MFEHPIAFSELPEACAKVLAGAPPMKMMAARGMAPLPPPALLSALYGLSYDADEKVAMAARATLAKLPPPVLEGALASPDLHPAVLDVLGKYLAGRGEVLERLVRHPRLAADSLIALASSADDALCEMIATNEQRLLREPDLIVALYMNRNLRMSTADRIVELAARNGVEPAIPGFRELAAALQNQLIPEAGEELPGDAMFRDALGEGDAADALLETEGDVVEVNEDGEKIKAKFEQVQKRLEDMNVSEKVRTALLGSAAQRAMLVRSPIRLIAMAAIQSPKLTSSDALKIASSRQVSEDVLRFIANERKWTRLHQTKVALVNNPKTPTPVSLTLLPHLHESDLRSLSKSRNVASAVKVAITQLNNKRAEKKG